VRVTLLIDNERSAPGLCTQWGFSAWIEAGGARVLLDSGGNDAFWRNARALGVPLESADAFVLSHGHFDHGGGLWRVVQAAPGARLVLHPGGLAPHFLLRKTGKVDPVGLPERSLVALHSAARRITWALGPVEAAPGVWASGPIPRHHALEEVERNFFLDRACTVRDQVVDDQAVWVPSSVGLIVVVGCAHAGMVNTLEYVRGAAAQASQTAATVRLPLAPDGLPQVAAVVGGMHLLQASSARLHATAEALAAAGTRLVVPVHCSGKRAKAYLHDRFGEAFVAAGAGSVLLVGGQTAS
jgi:7,8-dihydropterin-6-yl-methyl-4-(beta-D-ribofuranosyl)aminobenzene 5'-phosphate synthase